LRKSTGTILGDVYDKGENELGKTNIQNLLVNI
jgi:hypothetical protein